MGINQPDSKNQILELSSVQLFPSISKQARVTTSSHGILVFISVFVVVSLFLVSKLSQAVSIRKINPKPCSNALGEEGSCMFVWECIKTEGKHLGTCGDGFLYGSCCGHNETSNDLNQAANISIHTDRPVPVTTSLPSSWYGSSSSSSFPYPSSSPSYQPIPWRSGDPPASSTSSPGSTHRPTSAPFAPVNFQNLRNEIFTSPTYFQDQTLTTTQISSDVPPTNTPPTSHPPTLLTPLPTPSEKQYVPITQLTNGSKADPIKPWSPVSSPGQGTVQINSLVPEQQTQPDESTAVTLATIESAMQTVVPPINISQLFDPILSPDLFPQFLYSSHLHTAPPAMTTTDIPLTIPTTIVFETTTTSEPETITLPVPYSKPVQFRPNDPQIINNNVLPTTSSQTETVAATTTTSEAHITSESPQGEIYDPVDNNTIPSVAHPSFTPSTTSHVINQITTTKYVTQASTTTRPYINKLDCGHRPLKPQARVVGGRNALFGEWPWQVLIKEATWLGLFVKTKCGGVLIDHKWVLTAAHCQPGFLGSLVVIVGEYDLTGDFENLKPVAKPVRRMIVHRNYKPDTFENDIALLELESAFEVQPHVIPICLPDADETDDYVGLTAHVAGWGKLSYGGSVPSILQVVKLPIIPNNQCQKMFQMSGHHKIIRNTFICAGYTDGGMDSCEGDSGGPLMVQKDGQWTLIGTVSHGIKCAEPNLPGVYMRTSTYMPWITSILRRHYD